LGNDDGYNAGSDSMDVRTKGSQELGEVGVNGFLGKKNSSFDAMSLND
jgi:hypothetical protein